MAIQCITCGTQTRSGAKFCHACGTPVSTTSLPSTLPLGAAPPVVETRTPPPTASSTSPQPVMETEPMRVPSAYLPQTPQTYHTQPPAVVAPAKKSNKTLKVVLISLAVIMLLCIASVIGAVYFVSKRASPIIADMKRNGLPTVTTDAGSITDEMLGIPIYPDAKRVETVSGKFGPMSGGVVIFSTDDTPEEVAEFYRDEFKGKNQQPNEISDGDGDIVFQLNGDSGPRLITISTNNKSRKKHSGQTEIVVILGKGIPGMPGLPPLPPPPPGGAAENKARQLERQALEQAEKALRDLRNAPDAPPPPPAPPKH